ncbi:aminotransferase class V-fold PLP-dependent enzyme [Asanoa siamensis]|uniref:Cysteine desulfurase n=1 Tax=Asanoa siamensis TaxID=926357 RepID=A0ABQ4CPT9_9ACTN|nr:aminotransferase class V-fold PLP-dependent enzyme [Asanoa siamensis]GIF73318.1 cysteine desulfurase [Asanoa siamensis]
MTADVTHLDLAAPAPEAVLPDGRRVAFANLDYAATAPVARVAAEAVQELLPWYGSVHRGAGALSQKTTFAYERARQTIADFLGCRPADEVVFTRNTTDAMNLLAHALPPETLTLTFLGEHHAGLLPWPRAHRLPIPGSPAEAVASLADALAAVRTRDGAARPLLVAVTAASNVTGEIWPIAALVEQAHRYGARVAVDAAQLAPHRTVDLAAWGADYVAVSGHKLYAPFGCGVLAGRADWLDAAPPYLSGGGATSSVTDTAATVVWAHGPARHEAGTPNVFGAVALAAVCAELTTSDGVGWQAYETVLSKRLEAGLSAIPGVAVLRSFPEATEATDRVGIVSFAVSTHDSADLARWLSVAEGIGVREGLFCAHPLSRRLLADAGRRTGRPMPATALRASIGAGTTEDHVDRLVAAVAQGVEKSVGHNEVRL